VLHDGKLLVERSRDPECDAARALLAMGITGRLTMLDGKTGRPRTNIDIEKAAQLRATENSRRGPHFVKYRPFDQSARESAEGRAHSPEEPLPDAEIEEVA
jgi:hypothetical protein